MAALSVSALAQQTNLVKEIAIHGNMRVSREAILATMTSKVGQVYTQRNIDQDRTNLEDLGFFKAVDVRGTPIDNGANWKVDVDVSEWPVIKEIQISGNSVISTKEILEHLTLKPGQVFNRRELSPSSKAIEALYEKKGYFARVTDFGPSADSPGTIAMSITELKVGIVKVQGNKLTKDRVMRRLIRTRSGEIFSGTRWGNDLRRLWETGWFDDVTYLPPDTTRELGMIDLTAVVKEGKTGSLTAGLQLDPRSSLAGIVRYTQANIGGTGQSVGINFMQATTGGGTSVDLDYMNPFYDSKDTRFQASVYSHVQYRFNTLFGGSSSSINDEKYIERRTGGSAGFSRPKNDYVTYGLTGRYEGVQTDNIDSSSVQNIKYIQQDGNIWTASLSYTDSRRDHPSDPSKGYWANVLVEPGIAKITHVGGATNDPALIGTHGFVRTVVDYRKYFTKEPDRPLTQLDAPRHVWAVRAKYGAISGTIPYFEQFFVGGADSLRGYEDSRFWGRQMFLGTIEYRHPLQKSLNLIGFLDYGGAWGGYGQIQSYSQSEKMKLHIGYGPGISFKTPLGNIQLYLGFNEEGKSRGHFLIGSSF